MTRTMQIPLTAPHGKAQSTQPVSATYPATIPFLAFLQKLEEPGSTAVLRVEMDEKDLSNFFNHLPPKEQRRILTILTSYRIARKRSEPEWQPKKAEKAHVLHMKDVREKALLEAISKLPHSSVSVHHRTSSVPLSEKTLRVVKKI